MRKKNKKTNNNFRPAVSRVTLSTGQVVRMLRELKGWTQAELAARSKISVSNLSLLENGRVEIGRKRAELLANSFGVHPALIMFPDYDVEGLSLAA
jgi:transcriptional regulator with XRE-family HTH domain